jgi:methanogenic corrinoid protein MtbC1
MSKKQKDLDAVRDPFVQVIGAEEVKKRVKIALEDSASPTEILESLRQGIEIVGEKYEAQQYFLSELIMTGLMAEQLMDMLRARTLRPLSLRWLSYFEKS